jgi:hypothetical protein
VRKGLIVATVVLAAIFIVSGFHFRPGGPGDVDWVYSPGVCGPMHDQYGNYIGDAGPCRPAPTYPEQLEWAPFWVR